MISTNTSSGTPLVDSYGRHVTYLRMSVTDRCDFRCTYCMSERMQFLPKREILSYEELEAIALAFMRRGVRKLRLTGGEPLVRRDIMDLIAALGRHVGAGLDELTLTTNASRLAENANALVAAGIRRVNVSLDSRDPERFAAITRRGRLDQVLKGIAAATEAGLSVKINMVALAGINEDEIADMLVWTHQNGHDLTLIEAMPLGETGMDRMAAHLPLTEVRDRLASRFTLERLAKGTGGPARYFSVAETGGRLGFITPLSHNFCESCNRVRLTATGKLYLCLGQEDHVDLRSAYRDNGLAGVDAALDHAMIIKPSGHDFHVGRTGMGGNPGRHMSVTGG